MEHIERVGLQAAQKSKLVVTIEDHNIIGGIGTCVLEAIGNSGCAVPCVRLWLNDEFGSSGDCEELPDYFGLTAENIASKVHENL